MGNGAIGIPDTSELPIESSTSRYNLQNAAAALSPQATPPPGAIGSPAPGSTEDLESRALQGYQNPPSYQPDFSQLQNPQQFQQPQFQQPDLNDPLEQAKQTILGRIQDRQQQNQQRGSRIKNLLTNFLHGAGEGMMVHAGLPTPEMEHQRDLGNLVDISNAQANQRLKDLQTQDYALKVQKYPVLDDNGQPLRDEQGNVQYLPQWQAEQQQQHQYRMAERQPAKFNLNELLASSVQRDMSRGLRGPSPETLQIQQRIQDTQKPEAVRTVNTAEGVKQYDPATDTWKRIGGSPKSNVNLMTTNDAKDIADAIENGDQPPTLQGLYRNAGPVRAELARRGFNLAQAETDWKAVQRHIATLNGPQQTRLMQSIDSASEMVDKVDGLYQEWQQLAPTSGFKLLNRAALTASKNVPGRMGAVAQALDSQIADLTADLGNVYMGGNSPTDHALGLAAKNLSSDWNQKTFEEGLKQTRANIKIRKNSILHSQPVGVSSGSPYLPAQPAASQAPAVVDPFAQFGGKSR